MNTPIFILQLGKIENYPAFWKESKKGTFNELEILEQNKTEVDEGLFLCGCKHLIADKSIAE